MFNKLGDVLMVSTFQKNYQAMKKKTSYKKLLTVHTLTLFILKQFYSLLMSLTFFKGFQNII